MSNSIWKMPDQKPDIFKAHRILVIYEAHDEPELILSTEYAALTDHRYVNRWCYWDEFIAQADKAERLQKAVDLAVDELEYADKTLTGGTVGWETHARKAIKEIKQLIRGNQ